MQPTCPKCNMPLPEVETLEYRFCPGCGTEIPIKPETPDEAFRTIAPDLSAPPPGHRSADMEPETNRKKITPGNYDDETVAPQPISGIKKPELKPPSTPPPASFFRRQTFEKPSSISPGDKAPDGHVPQKRSAAKTRNLIIAGLVVLVLIILVLGGLFTF